MSTLTCVLCKGANPPKWIKVAVDISKATVVEYSSSEPTFKMAKQRVYPAAIIGPKPMAFASDRIMQLLADGWSVQKEDPAFSEDRLSFTLPFSDKVKLLTALEIITGKPSSKINIADWKPVLHDSILCTQASPTEITFVMVTSTCNEVVASRISAAMRCTSGETSVYDFMSDPIRAEPMLQLHRRYECLGDDMLDRLCALGINLRPVSFKDLSGHTAFVGF